MSRNFTALKSFIEEIIISFVTIIIAIYTIKGNAFFIVITGIIITLIFLYVGLRCYKLKIFEDKIEIYELFREMKMIRINEIKKIYIEKEKIHTRIEGTRRNIIFYTAGGMHIFNINGLINDDLYSEVENLAIKNNIEYICEG